MGASLGLRIRRIKLELTDFRIAETKKRAMERRSQFLGGCLYYEKQ